MASCCSFQSFCCQCTLWQRRWYIPKILVGTPGENHELMFIGSLRKWKYTEGIHMLLHLNIFGPMKRGKNVPPRPLFFFTEMVWICHGIPSVLAFNCTHFWKSSHIQWTQFKYFRQLPRMSLQFRDSAVASASSCTTTTYGEFLL